MNRPRPAKDRLEAALDAYHDAADGKDAAPPGPSPLGVEGELDAKLGQRELQRGLHYAFVLLGRVPWWKSEAEWTDTEFEQDARALIDLINRFPPLRVFTRLLGPLSGLGALVEKWSKLTKHRAPDATPPPRFFKRKRKNETEGGDVVLGAMYGKENQ